MAVTADGLAALVYPYRALFTVTVAVLTVGVRISGADDERPPDLED
jgi:hypothetical protein